MATFDSNFSAILALATGGAGTLATVLSNGNTTGDTALIVSDPLLNPNARIQGEDSGVGNAGELIIRGGNSTAGDGGDVTISAGTGTGNDGTINLIGDTNITGNISTELLRFGTGSPEGAVTAPVGTLYKRIDGTQGSTLYTKAAGVGNTGWLPVGPLVSDTLIGVGAAVFNTTRAFFTTGGVEPRVYLNGVRQRGDGNDYTATAPTTITFVTPPFVGDVVAIDYLPAD